MDAVGHRVAGLGGADEQCEGASPPHAVEAAKRLRRSLEPHRIAADVHDGYGLALVSVWVGLVVWCDADRFWWLSGWDERRGRAVYAWHPVIDPARAASRIARRYEHLRRVHPLSGVVADLVSAPHMPMSAGETAR